MAPKIQFGFVLKRKGGLGVVVHLQIETISHLAGGIDLHALVKVQRPRTLVPQGNHGVLNFLVTYSKPQFGRALRAHFHRIAAKNIFKGFVGNEHIGNQPVALAVGSACPPARG